MGTAAAASIVANDLPALASQRAQLARHTRDARLLANLRLDRSVQVRRAAWSVRLQGELPLSVYLVALNDSDATVRAHAMRRAPTKTVPVRHLARLLDDSMPEVRRAAAERLDVLAHLSVARLSALASDADPTTAALALRALEARMHTLSVRQVAALTRHPVGNVVALLLRYRGNELLPSRLDALLLDPRPEVMRAAALSVPAERLRSLVLAHPRHQPLWDAVRERVESRLSGPTEFTGNYGTSTLCQTDYAIVDGDPCVVLHVEGWQAYGSRVPARYRAASYLGGISGDGTGVWAVRVPSSVTTVRQALDAITPAAVLAARAAGRHVVRQGDLYAVETTRAQDNTAPTYIGRHHWDPETRTLSHPEHRTVVIDFPVRFYLQRPLPMRGSGRAFAD